MSFSEVGPCYTIATGRDVAGIQAAIGVVGIFVVTGFTIVFIDCTVPTIARRTIDQRALLRADLAAPFAVGTSFGVGVVVIALFTGLFDTIAADWVGRTWIARIGSISRIGLIGWVGYIAGIRWIGRVGGLGCIGRVGGVRPVTRIGLIRAVRTICWIGGIGQSSVASVASAVSTASERSPLGATSPVAKHAFKPKSSVPIQSSRPIELRDTIFDLTKFKQFSLFGIGALTNVGKSSRVLGKSAEDSGYVVI